MTAQEILNRFRDQIQADDGTALAKDGETYQDEAFAALSVLVEGCLPEKFSDINALNAETADGYNRAITQIRNNLRAAGVLK